METIDIFNPNVSYSSIDDKNILSLMETVRQGIEFSMFDDLFADKSPFSLNEWSYFLHLSERTMQRYKKEKRTFDSFQSEKILEIALLFKQGIEVFGNVDKFGSWLQTENLALGKLKPIALIDNSFGINFLKDELTRIEYGVLA